MKLNKILVSVVATCTIASFVPAQTISGAIERLPVRTLPAGDGAVATTQNSSKTAYNIYSPTVPPGWYYFATTRSVLDAEPGMSVQHSSAFDAHTYNSNAQGTMPAQNNVVGLFVNGVNAKAGAATWGLNTACDDSVNNTTASAVPSTCVGYEADFASYAASTFNGISLITQGPVMPAGADGMHISSVLGSTSKWINGYLTDDGAVTSKALSVGSLATTANSASQLVSLNYRDASAVGRSINLQSINGALNILSSQNPDGLALITGASSPILAAIGTSTNVNINYNAKGSGGHVFNAPASFSGGVTAAGFTAGSSAGVSCTAGTVNISTMVVTNGIITHC